MSSDNTSVSRLTQLAASILNSVSRLEATLSMQACPLPSFDQDAPTLLPKDAIGIRDSIIDCAAEIQDLLLGPFDMLYMHGSVNSSVSLQAISRFKIAELVPLGGRTTFASIAQEIGLGERTVRRLLRHATTMRVFHEPEPGVLVHTKASKLLRDPVANAWLLCGTEEMWTASVKMVEALEKWPESQEPNHTGFALSNNTGESIYEVLKQNPQRAARFGNNMKAFMEMQEFNSTHVVNNYDWKSLGQVRIVDVGGGPGHISLELAKHFPHLSFIVQDLEIFTPDIPDEVGDRIKYMKHDMFAPQTIHAEVYFFRWILHNWSDKYCHLILKRLIPMLTPGTKIIINEICMPEPRTISHWRERYLRSFDLLMGAGFASHERNLDEWKALFTEADPRFKFSMVNESNESALAIMEFVWTDLTG
ncbi:O-methyltransferase PaMT [Metarhizium brunneum]|uniref:O-methyltransferase PaMT n=1 Tax=Metarhizium brunneum TaxID=500148 RepID=A0A7D5ZE68_9HYPO